MPTLYFYATADDFLPILEFVFDQPQWLLLEAASRHDRPLRRFHSASAVREAFAMGDEDVSLFLYVATMGGQVIEHNITFAPGAVPGARGRSDAEGWGLIQLDLRARRRDQIRPSHTGHNSKARAQRWEPTYINRLGPADAWNWMEVNRVSSRLNRFIRKLGEERTGGRVILPMAARAVSNGAVLAANP